MQPRLRTRRRPDVRKLLANRLTVSVARLELCLYLAFPAKVAVIPRRKSARVHTLQFHVGENRDTPAHL